MQVRAKFRCHEVAKTDSGSENVKFGAVYGKDGSDNAQWSKFTPSGQLTMSITADGAQGVFVPGREYFLTIEEAPPPDAQKAAP